VNRVTSVVSGILLELPADRGRAMVSELFRWFGWCATIELLRQYIENPSALLTGVNAGAHRALRLLSRRWPDQRQRVDSAPAPTGGCVVRHMGAPYAAKRHA